MGRACMLIRRVYTLKTVLVHSSGVSFWNLRVCLYKVHLLCIRLCELHRSKTFHRYWERDLSAWDPYGERAWCADGSRQGASFLKTAFAHTLGLYTVHVTDATTLMPLNKLHCPVWLHILSSFTDTAVLKLWKTFLYPCHLISFTALNVAESFYNCCVIFIWFADLDTHLKDY